MEKQDTSIESMWKKYLFLIHLKESDLPLIQRQEMRRAFFGAVGLILDQILNTPENGIDIALGHVKEVEQFFKKEITNNTADKN